MTDPLPHPMAKPGTWGRKNAQQRLHVMTVWRRLATEKLGGGVSVYPDAPPGKGWVLAVEGQPKRYFATKEEAIARWAAIRRTIP